MTLPILNKQNKQTPIVIDILRDLLKTRKDEIDAWFDGITSKSPPFFYNSVDLRHSGFKLAPVDTNLFPAGFNNLNEKERSKAVEVAGNFFSKYHHNVKKVLLITEDFTRNTYYLDNIVVLCKIIRDAGCDVEISNFAATKEGTNLELESASGDALIFKPIQKIQNKVQTLDGFIPDMIIVNNDLTVGAPDILQEIEQPVVPPVGFGWYQRRKTSHFDTYNNLARDFCNKFNIDPWLISTYFQRCGVVNFKEQTGLECVALQIEKTLSNIRSKYAEYGITEEPYVFIKSDRGTYGMGIMTAKSGDELLDMNKKVRNQMNTIKSGVQNTEVIIQEGVPTIDVADGNPAEPMMYMLGGEAVGCIYRINTKKDSYGNLNSSGMAFDSIANHSKDAGMCAAYALISKLAAHAASWECYVESYNI